jgi:hypothetical protein
MGFGSRGRKHVQAHRSSYSSLTLFLFLLAAAVLQASAIGAAQTSATVDSESSPCASFINSKFPEAVLSNGVVQAVVYLPDAQSGYYRGSRFDWSGVVPCLSYKGHTYFGIWFNHYDPMIHDAIAGPVEEFRSGDGASSIGYDEAQPGGLFIKPGVGVLRKIDNSPYKFAYTYEQVDRGKWTVHIKRDQVTFTQILHSPIGISYVYEKTLKLAKNEPVLLLEHRLKNIGSKPIDSQVYDHNFFMIDKTPTGPGMVVHFPFAPQPKTDLSPRAAIEGHDLVYLQELSSQEPGSRSATVSSFLTGYSDKPSDYDFTVENKNTGARVEQTADVPISKLNFWSISTTICPEAYIHLNVAPGQTTHWTIRYRFFAK